MNAKPSAALDLRLPQSSSMIAALLPSLAVWLAAADRRPLIHHHRPGLRASRPIVAAADDVCRDTVCWALKNAKIESLEKMSATTVQPSDRCIL